MNHRGSSCSINRSIITYWILLLWITISIHVITSGEI
nr:MAG TPA: hypothetical protein [Caudoviricetes sp.]